MSEVNAHPIVEVRVKNGDGEVIEERGPERSSEVEVELCSFFKAPNYTIEFEVIEVDIEK